MDKAFGVLTSNGGPKFNKQNHATIYSACAI